MIYSNKRIRKKIMAPCFYFLLTFFFLFHLDGLAPNQAIAQLKTIVMGANPVGSLFYAKAAGMSVVIKESTGIGVHLLPQGGTVFFPMMETKEVDIGIASPIEALAGYSGTWIFEKPTEGKGYKNLATLLPGGPIALSLVVPGGSGVKTLKDLKGKRVVATYGTFFGSEITAIACLENAGLTKADVIVVPVTNYVEGVRAVIEGRADAAVASIGSAIIEELKVAKGAFILPLDTSTEAWKRTQKIFPGYFPQLVQPGPAGIEKPTTALGYDITIISRSDLPEDIAYGVVKALWTNAEKLGKYHASLKSWTPDTFKEGLKRTVIPFHLGAVKWYKEIDVWTKELEAHQKTLLEKKK